MPIDDERRRFSKTKARGHANPQTGGEGEFGSGGGVQEYLERLEEILLSQRRERAEFLEEEEKRVKANKEVAERARNERNEKYERLQQAFERMNKLKGKEKAEASREEPRVQDADGIRLVGELLERYRQQHADARAFVETMLRESREEGKEVIGIIRRRNPNPPERKS